MVIDKSKIKNRLKYILIAQFGFFVFSIAGVLSKTASKNEFFSTRFILLYSLQIICLFIFAFIWQQVLKNLSLTLAYINRGVTLFWSLLWSYLIFDDVITINNVIGIIIIGIGIVIGIGGAHD